MPGFVLGFRDIIVSKTQMWFLLSRIFNLAGKIDINQIFTEIKVVLKQWLVI